MMEFSRFVKHLLCTHRNVKRHFPENSLAAIKSAIHDVEVKHVGEIRFAIEAALHPQQVIQGMTPRERALQVFSELRIWDTQYNSGVLIYVLFADRAVEIVADRGIHAKTGDGEVWRRISGDMQAAFASKNFEAGAISAVTSVAAELARHFPVVGPNPNELRNDVQLL